MQDKEGYIWIATEDGLNRFDGNRFVIYRNIPKDTTSLINNHIMSIYEDSKERFWVATLTGLCLYDKTTDKFIPFKVPHFNNSSKEVLQFYHLIEDHQGYIWSCISGNGVVRIDADRKEFLYFNTMNSGICSNHINVIYEDRFRNIWFGSGQNGLSIYNPSNGTFRTFRQHPENKNGISSNDISSFCEDSDGNVWVGTMTGGINIYSFANQAFHAFDYDYQKISYLHKDSQKNIWIGTMGKGFDIFSTSKNKLIHTNIQNEKIDFLNTKVQTVFEDKQGNIWIGLFQKGVFFMPKKESFFRNHVYNPFSKKETVGEGAVSPLLIDSHQNLWLGVDSKGVYRLNEKLEIISHYGEEDKSNLYDHVATTLFEDSKEYVWIGTYLNGAMRYNLATNKFDLSLTKGEKPYGLLSAHVKDFKEDANGKLWIATSGGGVNIYNPSDKTFEYLVRNEPKDDDNQLIDNYCSTLLIDSDSIFWIGTFRGLCSYNPRNKSYTHYTFKNKKIPNDIVRYLKEDSKKNLWVGTENGMARICPDRKEIRMFNIDDGLPNSAINCIEEDPEGNLWIATNDGLSMYNCEKDFFTNYTTADGLHTNEFTKSSFGKTKDGYFFMGTMKGMISFNPAEKTDYKSEPLNLLFTDLYIFNEKVKIDDPDNKLLKKKINYLDKITLEHSQNSFSVEFFAVDYQTPQKIRYEVMMEGFDTQWRTVNNNMVTYTNLNPGKYTLTVKAWINDKEQALTRKLIFETLSPFWKTSWAMISYLLLLVMIGYMIYRYIHIRISTRQEAQLMQEKLQFFTDISHEIRTPLTLILSPLSKLINQNTDSSLIQTYNTMHRNGIRLLQLVNQVMDLRALEFGKKKLYTEETNITEFIRELKKSFNNLAEEKGLEFTFSSVPEEISGYIDQDIVAKVFSNIISNAFKYTESGGIHVSIGIDKKRRLVISISDTGKGIPGNQQKQIFERFFTTSTQQRSNSSGIGLHLTHKLTELHHGKIVLESKEGKGSIFSIIIPFLKEDYAPQEIKHKQNTSSAYKTISLPEDTSRKENQKHKSKTNFRYSLLVVDDNKDIRQLINSEFNNKYQIWEAGDGKEGLHIAMEKEPTLIISDVIMPKMDGIEFCEKIRNNEKTSLIPFIMLTGRSSIEEQIEGLECGADAYIPKPFDMQFLQAKIEHLIKSREKLKKKYIESPSKEEETPPASKSYNEKLLVKLNEFINVKLDDTDLSVDMLCKELGLSRTHLNRKMKELTGESPATYIRQLRLQKSVQLLKENNLTVSEIAFSVGFSSPSYFSQAFRDYYGITPKEFSEHE